MNSKTLKYIAILVLFLVALSVFVWYLRNIYLRRKKKEDNKKKKHDIVQLHRNIVQQFHNEGKKNVANYYDNYVNNIDFDGIFDCIAKEMVAKNIPSKEFDMKGNTIQEPIFQIYQKNPNLFSILHSCGYLKLLGKVTGVTFWWLNANSSSPDYLHNFHSIVDLLDWGNIELWKNLNNVFSDIQKDLEKNN